MNQPHNTFKSFRHLATKYRTILFPTCIVLLFMTQPIRAGGLPQKICAQVKDFIGRNVLNDLPLALCNLVRDMKSSHPGCREWNNIVMNCTYDMACNLVTGNFEWLGPDLKRCIEEGDASWKSALNKCLNALTNDSCDQGLSNNDQDGGACDEDRDCPINNFNYRYFCIEGRCKRRATEGQYCTPDNRVVQNGTGETKPPPYCASGLYCHCWYPEGQPPFWEPWMPGRFTVNPVRRCECRTI